MYADMGWLRFQICAIESPEDGIQFSLPRTIKIRMFFAIEHVTHRHYGFRFDYLNALMAGDGSRITLFLFAILALRIAFEEKFVATLRLAKYFCHLFKHIPTTLLHLRYAQIDFGSIQKWKNRNGEHKKGSIKFTCSQCVGVCECERQWATSLCLTEWLLWLYTQCTHY